MKRVLVVVSNYPRDSSGMNWNGLKDWLNALLGNEAHVDITALSKLVYVAGRKTAIYDPTQDFDLADFDLVVFRTVGKQIELGIAAAHYLKSKGVRFIDSYLDMVGKGKLSCSFPRVAAKLPIPQTIYASKKQLPVAIEKEALFSYPFILKSDLGKKGRDNFLIHSEAELLEVLNRSEAPMIAQEFIPNDGDYRVLVTNGEVGLVMLRKGDGSSHLNNTSQGGSAVLVDPTTLPKHIIEDSIRAAAIDRLELAGVDVVIDSREGKHYFLEVNRAPQIATGAFPNEKMHTYSKMIKQYVRSGNNQPADKYEQCAVASAPSTLGWREQVTISEFPGLGTIIAKIDTGAYSSSLHCAFIEETVNDKGMRVLAFSPFRDKREIVTTDCFDMKKVTSSNGVPETRYVVQLHVQIHGQIQASQVTLTDRGGMQHKLLIGRKFLRQHSYTVDVGRS